MHSFYRFQCVCYASFYFFAEVDLRWIQGVTLLHLLSASQTFHKCPFLAPPTRDHLLQGLYVHENVITQCDYGRETVLYNVLSVHTIVLSGSHFRARIRTFSADTQSFQSWLFKNFFSLKL